jgi:hypothetical protein
MSKNMVEPDGLQGRHNMANTSFMLDKQGYMHARTCTRPCARVHARTRARARTNMLYLLCFHGNNDSRMRLNVKSYVHCQSC